MGRLARHLLTICSVLSLLLCVPAGVLWARSFFLTERVQWRCAGGWRQVRTARGQVEVGMFDADHSRQARQFHGPKYGRDADRAASNWGREMNGNQDDTPVDWEWGGFAWHERHNKRRATL